MNTSGLKSLQSNKQVINRLWSTPALKLPPDAIKRLELTGPVEPVVPSSFRVGTIAQAAVACSSLSSAYVHQLRSGRSEPQKVSIDSRHAVLDFKSESWATLDGKLTADIWDPLAGLYRTKDGFVRVHTNFPHHRDAVVSTLGLPTRPVPSRETLARAFEAWSAQDFEDAVTNAGGCASRIRTFAEWDSHPHGIYAKNLPPLELSHSGDAPVRPLPNHKAEDLPLSGLRVLDLTRVIAGPVCGRTLAAHGADVIWVTSPNLPDLPPLDVDTSRGKRTVQLDLNDAADLATFRRLLKDADVLLHRAGALAKRGFGPEQLAKEYPGIITASLSAYGLDGPWGGRRGFDSLVQAATGFNSAEAFAYNTGHPDLPPSDVRVLPCQVLDHAAGHVLALGINAALARRITEGGSWHIQVSLLGIANWVRSLGQLNPQDAFNQSIEDIPPRTLPFALEVERLRVDVPSKTIVSTTLSEHHSPRDSGHDASDETKSTSPSNGPRTRIQAEGISQPRLRALRHAGVLEETPVRVGYAPGGLNSDKPQWLDNN